MIWFLLVQVVILTVFVVLVARRTAETDKSLLGVMASVDDLCKRVKRLESPGGYMSAGVISPTACECGSRVVDAIPDGHCLQCGREVRSG